MPQSFPLIGIVAISRLMGVLQVTVWQLIYGLNLGTGTPARNAEEAKKRPIYVARTIGPRLLLA